MSVIDVIRRLVDAVPLSDSDRQQLHDALDAETPAPVISTATGTEGPAEEPVNPAPVDVPAEAPTEAPVDQPAPESQPDEQAWRNPPEQPGPDPAPPADQSQGEAPQVSTPPPF